MAIIEVEATAVEAVAGTIIDIEIVNHYEKELLLLIQILILVILILPILII